MPTFAPIYVCLYTRLAERARELGYALAVHGSAARDLDLLAAPWTDAACAPEELWAAIVEACAVSVGDAVDGAGARIDQPSAKPHGRLAWSIPLGCGAVLDLSVMPRLPRPA
jgi:hypothetical protein